MNSIRRYRQIVTLCAIAGGLAYSPSAAGAPARERLFSPHLVTLESGVTRVDLNGDGVMDMVTKSRVDIGNAHNSSVYRFLLRLEAPYFSEVTWVVVPIQFPGEDEAWPETSTTEGASCILRDIRLLVDKQGKESRTTLIVANRDFGESFADEEDVTFNVFRFETDHQSNPGSPTFYFRHVTTIAGKSKHCDINQAFKEELGLD